MKGFFTVPVAGSSVTVSAFYFLCFLAAGAYLPFYSLWLQSIGITENQIGVIAACPSIILVLTTLSIGGLADRARDWRSAIITCNIAVALFASLLPLVHEYVPVLLVWTLWSVLLLAMMPILDAASIRMARHRSQSFDRMRAMGSVGFIVGVWLIGRVIDSWGIDSFLWLLIILAWVRAAASLSLPRFRDGLAKKDTEPLVAADFGSIRSAWFVYTLVGAALIHASHAYFYTMGSVIWRESGYDASTISGFWVLAVSVEVGVMWVFASIARRFSARKLLLMAGVLASIRWLIFGFDVSFPVLLFVQTLHGITFALLFLATINFIANWTPVHIAARAQSFGALLNTICMSAMTLVSGYIYTSLGTSGYWLMMLPGVCGLLMIGLSLTLQAEQSLD